MKILLVASDPMEFSGMVTPGLRSRARPHRGGLGAVRATRRPRCPADRQRRGGSGRAAAAVDSALDFGLEAVVSTGFCGALDDTLDVADRGGGDGH